MGSTNKFESDMDEGRNCGGEYSLARDHYVDSVISRYSRGSKSGSEELD
ncbi:hypothetical protein [Mechercharimyces sp. CAU 1602]|nr:hypothetical protein [Mechercharimyces sp. CAU 1602]